MRLGVKEKIEEYIFLLDSDVITIEKNDKVHTFSSGEYIGYFFSNYKKKIYNEVTYNSLYKDCINAYKAIHDKMDELDYIADYIELLNNNSITVLHVDYNNSFSNGKRIGYFYKNNSKEINDRLSTDIKYSIGYENAKEKLKDKIYIKVDEYIELVNNNQIEIKNNDSKSKFSNGDTINRFWYINKDKIYNVINNEKRFENGYENAKNKINSIYNQSEVKKELSLEEKIDEYIELVRINKICVIDLDIKNKFSNGESINKFFLRNKTKIIERLNNNKYNVGYEDVKIQINNHNSSDNIIDEFIELAEVNISSLSTSKLVLSNGTRIDNFLYNHKEQIIYRLTKCSKYKIGYLNLKRKLGIEFISKSDEEKELGYVIECLNDISIDLTHKTITNSYIHNYLLNNKNKIIKIVLNDPKYNEGYEVLKTRLFGFSKLDEYIDLVNTYTINIENDEKFCFKDGTKIGKFWCNNKKNLENLLKKYTRYGMCYELARIKINGGCSRAFKNKEYLRKVLICEKYRIDYELNKDILNYIPSELFEPILILFEKNMISYLDRDGKLLSKILITEKELIVKYGLDIDTLIKGKEKVNTL